MRVPPNRKPSVTRTDIGLELNTQNLLNILKSSRSVELLKTHQNSSKSIFTNVEIMYTSNELQQGMQGRTFNGIGGMLFIVSHNHIEAQRFHTNNCIVPMDIIFLDTKGMVLDYYANIQPNMQGINGFGALVLELPATSVFKHKISIGTKFKILP